MLNDLPEGAFAVATPTDPVERLLRRARSRLDRLHPVNAAAEVAAGALLVDTRPEFQRRADGDIPGAIVEATDLDLRWVVICDEGYSSSFAAVTLRLLGLRRATDVIGGFRAWRAAGLPVECGETPVAPRLYRR